MLSDNLKGWDGGRDGREVQEGENICILTTDPCCCTKETNTCKAIVLQIKINSKKF